MSSNIKRDIYWRIALTFVAMLFLGIALIWKIFSIQTIHGNYYRGLADSLTTGFKPIAAERGNIFSADGKLLATSLPSFEIRMDMKAEGLSKSVFAEGVDSLAIELSNLFKDGDAKDYLTKLTRARNNGARYFLIHRNVSYPQYLAIKKFHLFRLGQNSGGLIAIQINKRIYPYQLLANRTIGYTRDATVQPVGLEGNFNSELSGVNGRRLYQKISGGAWVPINSENELEPQNGKDIITTIDINLQDVAENALMNAVVKNKADHGSVMVMDVKTGEIKAIANLGLMPDGTYTEKFNYAVGESNEPGSTFKLASVIAMLEDGLVKITDTVDVERGHHLYYGGQMMNDAEEHNLTRISLKEAFAHSSNVGISKLVVQNYEKNPDQFLNHLHELHLDSKINLEIPGVSSPVIQTKSGGAHWSRFSLPWMSVGYELQVSPLQILTLYNAVANNGVMVKPHLVSSIEEYGKPVKVFGTEILNPKICSDETLASLKEILEAVVEEGTARNLKNNEYSIAGKTGTAQVADKTLGYAKQVYQSSFVGFFPADKPLYSCIVVVYAPSNGVYYGSAVAGPVFKEIADQVYATNLSLHPDYLIAANTRNKKPVLKTTLINDAEKVLKFSGLLAPTSVQTEWVKSFSDTTQVVLDAALINEKKGIVPDVRGMGLKDAVYLLENAGIKVNVLGYGTVRSQSINAGTAIADGETIYLTLN